MSPQFKTGNVYYPKSFREHLAREEMRAHWPPDNGPGWAVSLWRRAFLAPPITGSRFVWAVVAFVAGLIGLALALR